MAHRLFITSAVLVGAALPASAAAQSGGFLVMLGRDTVQVERFTRSADRIEGTVVFRSPRTRVVKYDLQLAPNGTFTRYEQTIFSAEGKRIEPDAANATFTYVGDTIVRQTVRGTEPITQRIAAPNGAVPLLGSSLLVPFSYSFVTYELAVARARASAQNGESRLSLLGTLAALTTPQSTRVWLIGEDSAEVDYFGLARSGFKFDAQGRLLRADWTATTYKYRVSRIAAPDVDALARGWAALDAAGRGLGVYSPRDTTRTTIGGRVVWVDYSRPSQRERQIWGAVVPWDRVWRLGADFATQLRTETALQIGPTVIPAGIYSLWMLPSSTEPALIVNRQSGQFGTQYDARQDLARIPLRKSDTSAPVELFTIGLREQMLRIEWDDAAYSVALRPAATPGGPAGSYAITKSVAANTCGHNVALRDAQLLVTAPSGGALTILDGATTFTATLNADGAFASAPVTGNNPDGWQLSVILSGKFRSDGFDGRLGVDVKRETEPQTCRYEVNWAGKKLGL